MAHGVKHGVHIVRYTLGMVPIALLTHGVKYLSGIPDTNAHSTTNPWCQVGCPHTEIGALYPTNPTLSNWVSTMWD